MADVTSPVASRLPCGAGVSAHFDPRTGGIAATRHGFAEGRRGVGEQLLLVPDFRTLLERDSAVVERVRAPHRPGSRGGFQRRDFRYLPEGLSVAVSRIW